MDKLYYEQIVGWEVKHSWMNFNDEQQALKCGELRKGERNCCRENAWENVSHILVSKEMV
jgi:hypothetical protein